MPLDPPAPPKPVASAKPDLTPPASPPEPSPAPSKGFMDTEAAELDAMASGLDTEPPKPEPKKPSEVEPPKKDETTLELEKVPEKPHDLEAPEPVKIVELRTAYRGMKKRIKEELMPELTKSKNRITELETQLKVNQAQDLGPIQKNIDALQKRNKELEDQMEFVDFTRSNKYLKDYVQPYNEQWARALGDFQQLKVALADGNYRMATENDIITLGGLSAGELDEKAEEMFGRSAPRVIRHIERLRELYQAQQKAIKDAQDGSKGRREQQALEAKTNGEKLGKLWTDTNKALADKYSFFRPSEGDNEGNALLQKGYALADRLFTPTDETKPKSPEEMIELHALIRNKVANHDRLAYRLKSANARIKELQAALDEYEAHEPKGGTNGSPSKTTLSPEEEANQEIDALVS